MTHMKMKLKTKNNFSKCFVFFFAVALTPLAAFAQTARVSAPSGTNAKAPPAKVPGSKTAAVTTSKTSATSKATTPVATTAPVAPAPVATTTKPAGVAPAPVAPAPVAPAPVATTTKPAPVAPAPVATTAKPAPVAPAPVATTAKPAPVATSTATNTVVAPAKPADAKTVEGNTQGGKTTTTTVASITRPTEVSTKLDAIAVASTGPTAATKSDAQIAQAIIDLSSGKITAEELARQLGGGLGSAGNGDAVVLDPNSLEGLVARAYGDINPVELTPWTGNLVYRGGIDWDNLFLRAASDASVRDKLQSLSTWQAETVGTNVSIYRRAITFQDIPIDMVDSIALNTGLNKSARALAMSDCTQTYFLVQKAVPLAVAARFTGNQVYLDKVIEILRETALYVPLQRQGWSLGTANATMHPEGDGPNMATAWGVSAIVDMLDILGPLVPMDLQDQLKKNLRNEVHLIVKAWALKLPWYVQSRSVMSNQWTDPNVAMIKACLYLGDPTLLPAYNLGVENLAATLRASQSDGAFLEGFAYAQMSGGAMVSIIGNIHANNDLRCDQYPFLAKFWRWLLQMQMPGQYLVNCADCNLAKLPPWSTNSPLSSIVDAAFASGDTRALEAVKFAFPKSEDTLSGLQYFDAVSRVSAPAVWPLPLYEFFPSQQLLVWKSAYEAPAKLQSALGLWIKGGTLGEKSHGHRDQGQISVYKGNNVILLDCGTPHDYGDPQLDTVFASAAGHNIMQIGELQPRVLPVNAPMNIIALNGNGGHVILDLVNASTAVTSCTREISWDRLGGFSIDDKVQLKSAAAGGTEFYRFHTGSLNPVTITGQGKEWTATWAHATMSFFSDIPILVEQMPWRDEVLDSKMHQVLTIRVLDESVGLRLQSTLNVP